MRKQRNGISIRIGLFAVLAALLLAAIYQGGRWLERQGAQPEARGDYRQRYGYDTLLEYEGVTYRLRKNVTTLLLMGIDQPSGHAGMTHRSGGQADFLRLVIIDRGNRRVTQMAIDRDTMTPIAVLGVLGDRAGERTAQVGLSHGFGDGKAQSCQLTAEAVSGLLLDTPIDAYIAMNMDGIAMLNDLAGGVRVTLEDDFSKLDPSMTPGTTLTLKGDQATIYVRSRRNVEAGTNEDRMARQEEYLSQLARLLDERLRNDKEFIGTLYDSLEPYLTTNLSRGQMINEAWNAAEYERAAPVQLKGTHQLGTDGFMQFHADEAALRRTVAELFYEKIE